MNNLSATELKVLNSLSHLRNPSVSLGSKVNELIGHVSNQGTPKNAVNASVVLTVSGVVKHGEKITINNPLIAGADVYEFLADEAQTKSAPTNIAVDITDYATKASVVLTLDTQPTSGDKFILGTKEYTFVPVGTDTADGEISIGSDLAEAKLALVAAINGTDEFNVAHPLVSAGAFVGNALTITALKGGTAGNAIPSTETFTAGTNVFATVTLASGTDCSAANAILALVVANTASHAQGVTAVDGAGDTVVFTAVVAGEGGNNISVSETMPNGAFAEDATTMSSGEYGTIGYAGKIMFDDNYLYFCVADNDQTGKNWTRQASTAATF